ncbi:RagB/SusD family nutrient uptake outer membrane protein [Sphingobacterium sp. SGR-19]|uniref:RagB/SusD family nutrient uptake outer membrane protein n=1 Tax=Sphingobacterium sp. SGR-19 TaxID=2710886 RepID=UPI0013ECCC32|nr:RagB/SusD family nutrient uptake outer membrane protein [Sphingobacterium sp. SGR-19]NGM67323.1 RagB/SusD family nutrient uptake outer membrane protein [Sphingobacterium sp. SGR-19]
MKTKIHLFTTLVFTVFNVYACTNSDFLNVKPNSGILTPSTLEDVQKLLNNNVSLSSGLAVMSSDEYVVTEEDWNVAPAIERNAYVWAKDLYEGTRGVLDWDRPFRAIFYANNALAVLEELQPREAEQVMYDDLKGQALFKRAFASYELIRNFCKSYEEASAETDLGIPIRKEPAIDRLVQRSSLTDSYQFVLDDLILAAQLLGPRLGSNLFRPNDAAAHALLARIYLDMGRYAEAELHVDSTLFLYDRLIDYNTVSTTSETPFPDTHEELLFNAATVGLYRFTTSGAFARGYRVAQDLIDSYSVDDLRLQLYFLVANDEGHVMKRGYFGTGLYPFTGLAVDEVYLIKAECLARSGKEEQAVEFLLALLAKRYVSDKMPSVTEIVDGKTVLETVLEERRKELVWRGLRWHDIKRYNRDGYNIRLTRTLGGTIYTLPPNDPRFVFPIPDDEIEYGGLQQNDR